MAEIYDFEVEMQKPWPLPGVGQRVLDLMSRAGETLRETAISAVALAQAKTEAVAEASRAEKLGGALAAVAMAGAAYLEYKGVTGAHDVKAHLGHVALSAHQEPTRHVAETTLHYGDNPWTVTEHQLEAHGVAHPTDQRIAADDARLLRLNHISPLQALKLQVGEKLKLLKRW